MSNSIRINNIMHYGFKNEIKIDTIPTQNQFDRMMESVEHLRLIKGCMFIENKVDIVNRLLTFYPHLLSQHQERIPNAIMRTALQHRKNWLTILYLHSLKMFTDLRKEDDDTDYIYSIYCAFDFSLYKTIGEKIERLYQKIENPLYPIISNGECDKDKNIPNCPLPRGGRHWGELEC